MKPFFCCIKAHLKEYILKKINLIVISHYMNDSPQNDRFFLLHLFYFISFFEIVFYNCNFDIFFLLVRSKICPLEKWIYRNYCFEKYEITVCVFSFYIFLNKKYLHVRITILDFEIFQLEIFFSRIQKFE